MACYSLKMKKLLPSCREEEKIDGMVVAERYLGTTRVGERSSDDLPEFDLVSRGAFSGHKRLPAGLRGTSTENRDHSDPRAPRDIQGTLRKSRSQVPRPPRANSPRPRVTSQRSPTGQKGHRKRVSRRYRCTPSPNDMPFRSLPSRAITFKGFLIALTLPREEVVTIRGPIHRAQPPFHRYSLTGFSVFIPDFLSLFRVHLGLGTFGSVHGRVDLPLRSPRSPTSHRAVTGASVPTHFPLSCRGCLPLGSSTRSPQPESCDSHGRFPDSFPLATRLEGLDPRGGDRHGRKEALEPLGRASLRRAVSLFGLLGSMTLSSSRIKSSLGAGSP
ncbi:hypothetical protein CRG98_030191 [Punica granatum]|uniref:Uncharacterized protein n=1 Tax=Punica granatum TaxID=22663 RepID=A0A2I0IZJ1_PUNGR|nr:hypothetical protein CRG98_030191 [Punica granatum]